MSKLSVGKHLLGSLYNCPVHLLKEVEQVRDIMYRTVKEAKFNCVGDVFHQYEPFGVTGVILISDSHFSIHTWPEHRFAAVDIFSCSKESDTELAFDILCKYLLPERAEKQLIER
ncbi:MAG: adenosylmethionine decarboxylase [Candidatus Thermoplasmatota archaeon]|jgi:S-adenosylmethionine decarboxylase|nr:adenosylmethionine decarboxylase [Candidatus Thermoplasmatota archaeon]MDP7265327.1 adenosylmethionine decarboxylase [Candidatus Thermoplasmatota archaeon]